MKETINQIKNELGNVKLIAVSKTYPREKIDEAIQCGVMDFGENKVQELLTKVKENDSVNWHFIGHLQRNKVKDVVKYCSLIHSVDSIRLMDEINAQAYKQNKVMDILLQVNLAQEATKSGFNKEETLPALRYALNLSNIKVKGLMIIGPHCEDDTKIEAIFAEGENLFHQMQSIDSSITELSMGMSDDYHIALKHHTTMVRIGSKIFGKRY